MMVPLQCEFPLRVAVCAWCKPQDRGVDPGATLDPVSHGICPRHLRKLKQKLQVAKNLGLSMHPTAVHSRRAGAFRHPELNYPS